MDRPAPIELGQPGPRPGEMLPYFSLPSTSGGAIDPWRYRGRRNLVLVFAGEGSGAAVEELLRAFARRYPEHREEEAEVLAIAAVSPFGARHLADRLGLPYPVLADVGGAIHRRYGAAPGGRLAPAVYVADRYGEVQERWPEVGGSGPLPAQEEVLDRLRFVEIQCPE